MESQGENRQYSSQEEQTESQQGSIDHRSGGIFFGDQAVVQGDVVGGNKYEVRFYALSSSSESGQVSWNRYRQESQSTSEEPYKFLSYYDTLDADIFYGREVVSDLLVSKISNHKLVLINGKSGSGKTSLINAGIVPRLTERGYFTIIFRDYGYPTDIIKAGIDSLENVEIDLSSSRTLTEILHKTHIDAKRPIAIFLDQFERFFLNLHVNQQAQFIQEFSECLNSIKSHEIAIIISVRQDFYGNLGEFWKASPEFNTESYQYYLESLSRSEALDAIKKPLQRLYPKIIYDPDFLENQLLPHLLKKTGDKLDANIEPVHLQIVCNRLFDEVRTKNQQKLQNGETIIIKKNLYEELGGVQGILLGYVDSILAQFTPKEREEAKSILKQMVTGQGTRAFRTLTEIKTQLNLSEDEVEKIIQQLDRSRLIETIPSERKYSLTHEYLVQKINQWYDIRELEIKKAKELFDRCLINWKLYKSPIPREQFQAIKRYKSNLSIDEEGEKLFKRSSQIYYGTNFLIGFAISGLFLFLADQLFHRFYLIPHEIGRLKIQSLKGEDLHKNAELFTIKNDGTQEKYQFIWGFPYLDGIPRGLYYAEVKYNGYIVKQPVKIDGYRNYNEPVILKIPTDKLSLDLVKEMALVPKGNFIVGNPSEVNSLEKRSVVVDSFYIDKYEVTNQDYKKFLEEVAANPESYQVFYNDQPQYKKDKDGHKPGLWGTFPYQIYSKTEMSPVINVDWYDAFAYCAWQGKRLPTVLEWEKAASGRDEQGQPKKYAYPWGNEPDITKANTIDKWPNQNERRTEEVGKYQDGASLYGVFDLIGNASEWTDIWYVEPIVNKELTAIKSGYHQQALKGGSFGRPQQYNSVYETPLFDISQRDPQYGFRCAISKSDD